ncbi:MAG: VPLPA-CTERM sorting domain-containing protein [Pseudomonadota bacterium]
MTRLLTSTALVLAPLSFAFPAFANCDDLSPGNNDTVTCTVAGGPENGFIDDNSDNITINIEPGAVFNNTDADETAIKMRDPGHTINVGVGATLSSAAKVAEVGDGTTIDNQGTITSAAGEDAIQGETRDELPVDGEDERVPAVNITLINGSATNTAANITAGNDAIQAGDGLTVTNYGSINAEGDVVKGEEIIPDGTGFEFDGADGVTVNNYGTMIGDKGINVDDGEDFSLTNRGRIEGTDKTVEAGDRASVINEASGIIKSTNDEGVELDDDAFVNNAGTIEGFDDALQVGERATILNSGRIENTQGPADIVGSIEAQDAIDIDSGDITNTATGVIKSTTNAAIDFDPSDVAVSTITNYGEIEGTIAIETDVDNDKSQHIENFGTITGTSGLAMNLGGGDDSYVHHTGGILNGGADFGAGEDTFTFADDFFVYYAADFGGVIDGGDDTDTMDFAISSTYVTSALLFGDTLSLQIVEYLGTPVSNLMIRSWENLKFSDGTFTAAQLSDQLAPIPLPASMVLLGGALGGLGLMRRRKRRAVQTG